MIILIMHVLEKGPSFEQKGLRSTSHELHIIYAVPLADIVIEFPQIFA